MLYNSVPKKTADWRSPIPFWRVPISIWRLKLSVWVCFIERWGNPPEGGYFGFLREFSLDTGRFSFDRWGPAQSRLGDQSELRLKS